ncbi:putative inner membrane transporter YedA [Phycisphaerae bacterium RAS2]|nr:putative inner membrane transporter YedA [Phycisphaerae bacterium RAS2]
MTNLATDRTPRLSSILLAYLGVYVVWGSTYLAIAIAVKSIPPFWMASARFLIAGLILYVYARWSGAPRPTRLHWRNAAIIGTLLLLGGNGGVVWAEKHVPSGLAALMVATVPLWFALVEWLRPGGKRPPTRAWLGIALGFVGLAVLFNPARMLGGDAIHYGGAAALVMASFLWSCGSIYSRHAKLPESGLLTTGMEMLAGSVALGVFGAIVGDWRELRTAAITTEALLAVAYLIVFGSLIGFTCYMWLLKVSTPHRVATYAYVNPVVAVFLGWLLADEKLGLPTMLATPIIVLGVVFITTARATSNTSIDPGKAISTEPRPSGSAELPCDGVSPREAIDTALTRAPAQSGC